MLGRIFLTTARAMKMVILNNRFLILCLLVSFCLGCASTVSSSKAARPIVQVSREQNIKARVIIDPGHGGNDSGAVGKKGLLEKNITLDIAKRLTRLMASYLPNVEVILTRKSDHFVNLEDRIRIANQQQGDLFLSLHVNSSESKDAGGFEIYSLDIASDRHAERLAARENKEINKNGKRVDFILADLRAFSHRNDSDKLAKAIANGLKSQLSKNRSRSSISDRGYNQAIFHVLFVKMPAVLAELFFISNPHEERMLSNKTSRENIARGLFMGVRSFLASNAMRAQNGRF